MTALTHVSTPKSLLIQLRTPWRAKRDCSASLRAASLVLRGIFTPDPEIGLLPRAGAELGVRPALLIGEANWLVPEIGFRAETGPAAADPVGGVGAGLGLAAGCLASACVARTAG